MIKYTRSEERKASDIGDEINFYTTRINAITSRMKREQEKYDEEIEDYRRKKFNAERKLLEINFKAMARYDKIRKALDEGKQKQPI